MTDPSDIYAGDGQAMLDVQRMRQPLSLPRGLDGIPRAGAGGLIKPQTFNIKESASVWVQRRFSRPVYVWCPGGNRVLRYVPDFLQADGAALISRGLYYSSISGIVRIPAAGDWYFNTPIVTAEGTDVAMNYADALGDVGVDPSNIIGASSPGAASVADPAVWADLVPLAVGVASVTVYAALASRRGLALFNSSLAGQTISISVTTPATDRRGVLILPPNVGYVFGPTDKCTQQALYAIADAAAGQLSRASC